MILFQEQELSIRKLDDRDADLLLKWLTDPEVLKYYGGRDRPYDMDLVHQHFYDKNVEETRCIILYGESEIGYIQFYEIDNEEKEKFGYQDFKDKIYGMDQFIGETPYWNKGIGTQLIKETVKYLSNHKNAVKVIMDPQAWNSRALRVYEKNGFMKKKFLKKHEWHEGEHRDCWLIEFDVK